MTLLEAPKETGNKLFNKINWKILEIIVYIVYMLKVALSATTKIRLVCYDNYYHSKH